jgi:hypothetical protein
MGRRDLEAALQVLGGSAGRLSFRPSAEKVQRSKKWRRSRDHAPTQRGGYIIGAQREKNAGGCSNGAVPPCSSRSARSALYYRMLQLSGMRPFLPFQEKMSQVIRRIAELKFTGCFASKTWPPMPPLFLLA